MHEIAPIHKGLTVKHVNVKYLSDYPFSIGFGGKEIQLLTYCNHYLTGTKYNGSLLNYFDRNQLDNCDILHIFGYSTWYRSVIKNLKNKNSSIKVICSPNFYRKKEYLYAIANKVCRYLPLRNYFSELTDMFHSFDGLIFNSNEELLQHERIFGSAKNATVIYNGIQDDFCLIRDTDCRTKLKYLPDKYLLSVGFFDERKNTNALIEAFIEEFKNDDIKLVLVGSPRFAAAKRAEKFKQLIQENRDKVVDFGFLKPGSNQLKFLYKNSIAHVLPSYLETPGISNLEALAFGKPVVVGDCAPVREYLKDTPVYCNPRSLPSISKGMRQAANCSAETYLPDYLYYSSLSCDLVTFYDQCLYE